MKLKLFSLAAALLLACSTAFAAAPLKVATGKKDLTYNRFFKEIADVCSQPAIEEVPTNGSRDNLDKLASNEVALGFVQMDVLFGRKLIDGNTDVDNIRTLIPLYNEEVHLIVPASSNIQRFTDIGNKRLVTTGGGLITARVIFGGMAGVRPLQILEAASPEQAKAAIDGNKADVMLLVGGAPIDAIKVLPPGRYRLVSIDDVTKLADVYSPATLTYSNLGASVRTVATQSLLAVYNYEGQEMRSAVLALRSCVLDNLTVLRERTGYHQKWRSVRADATSKWPAYAGATQAASKKKKQ